MSELPTTLRGLKQAIACGEIAAAEALRMQRERLIALDATFHAVTHFCNEDPGLAPTAGPLAGIGLAHKDIFDLPDRSPGVGLDRGRANPGLSAAPAIKRLRESGAACLAMLTMAEFACGATGANLHFERCVNPLNPLAVVGGSSSGSAVAVACGMAYGALGTDTAGSVRIPAATCGVVGLKTTHGLVPRTGVQPLAPSLDSVGILARNAVDISELLPVIAEPGCARKTLGAPRVAAWIPSTLDPEVGAALERFAADVRVAQMLASLDGVIQLNDLAEVVLSSEAAQVHRQRLIDREAGPGVEAVALSGLAIPVEWHAIALNARPRHLRQFVEAHLMQQDILLLPALSHPIPDWEEVTPGAECFDAARLLGLYRHMGFVNYLGLPAVVFPIAQDRRGLPISVQALARPYHEATLLAFAASHALPLPTSGVQSATELHH